MDIKNKWSDIQYNINTLYLLDGFWFIVEVFFLSKSVCRYCLYYCIINTMFYSINTKAYSKCIQCTSIPVWHKFSCGLNVNCSKTTNRNNSIYSEFIQHTIISNWHFILFRSLASLWDFRLRNLTQFIEFTDEKKFLPYETLLSFSLNSIYVCISYGRPLSWSFV